jgi:hypothetical protein
MIQWHEISCLGQGWIATPSDFSESFHDKRIPTAVLRHFKLIRGAQPGGLWAKTG